MIYSGMDWSEGLKPAVTSFLLPSELFLKDVPLIEVLVSINNPPVNVVGEYTFAIAGMLSGSSEFVSNIDTLDFEGAE